MTGVVKFYNQTKGIGFIVCDGSGTEVFVHNSFLIDQIIQGDTVEFDLEQGKKMMNAVRVRKI